MSSIHPDQAVSPSLLRVFAAMVYDTLLLAAISIGYGALVTLLAVAIQGAPAQGERLHFPIIVQIAVSISWLLLLMSFYVYFWCRFGQSLGMKTWRIQVVDANTLNLVQPTQAVKRACWALVSLLCLGMGYWISFAHPQGRFLHDLLSKTRLVLLKKSK